MQQLETELSERSKTFLQDLRVYLFSSGKNSEAIDDIVEELEVHLIEAEKNGKPIDKIIGKSPKAYMNQLSNEMPIDYKAWLKYIPIIIFGVFSFTIVGDLIHGTLSYSLLEIAGFIGIIAICLISILGAFKYISSNNISKGKESVILYVVSLLQIGLFVGLIFLNNFVTTPVIHFGFTGTIITAIITFIFLIGVTWWAKTGVLLILITLLYLPEYLLGFASFQESTQLIVSTFISITGIAIYLFITVKMTKEK